MLPSNNELSQILNSKGTLWVSQNMLPSNSTDKYPTQQPACQSQGKVKNNYITCLFSHRLLTKFNKLKLLTCVVHTFLRFRKCVNVCFKYSFSFNSWIWILAMKNNSSHWSSYQKINLMIHVVLGPVGSRVPSSMLDLCPWWSPVTPHFIPLSSGVPLIDY